MPGREDYTREEYDHGRAAVAQQLSTYRRLATAVSGAAKGGDAEAEAALDDFERVSAAFFAELERKFL
jgi:hypothetical protein